MATTTVVVRQITAGPEATRILDALDAAVEIPSDRLSDGRRYILSGRLQTSRADAAASLERELDRIDAAWAEHVVIAGLS
jgi:hypothetical protein